MTIQPNEVLQPEDLLLQLRALRAQIPDFVPLPRAEMMALARASGVSPRLIEAAITRWGTNCGRCSAASTPRSW